MMLDYCKTMDEGEILNENHPEYPLFDGVLYGDKILTAKFSKRLSCAIKHLPIRIKFHYEYNTQKAIEKGISKDPTFVLNNKIFLEGLVSAEEITQKFEGLLNGK